MRIWATCNLYCVQKDEDDTLFSELFWRYDAFVNYVKRETRQLQSILLFPQLNPIEVCFALLEKWIQHHANLAFPICPEMVLEGTSPIYAHCGYEVGGLKETVFDSLAV